MLHTHKFRLNYTKRHQKSHTAALHSPSLDEGRIQILYLC